MDIKLTKQKLNNSIFYLNNITFVIGKIILLILAIIASAVMGLAMTGLGMIIRLLGGLPTSFLEAAGIGVPAFGFTFIILLIFYMNYLYDECVSKKNANWTRTKQ